MSEKTPRGRYRTCVIPVAIDDLLTNYMDDSLLARSRVILESLALFLTGESYNTYVRKQRQEKKQNETKQNKTRKIK